MHALETLPRGRHKKRAESGQIRFHYLLVKHPAGGYGESAYRVGSEVPEALPHIEIDVGGELKARRRGARWEDFARLLQELETHFCNEQAVIGLPAEIDVRTDGLGDIGRDADFWPRAYLDLDGSLRIRARNSEEADRFLELLGPLVKAGILRNRGDWHQVEIKGGTPHEAMLQCDTLLIQRVISKISYCLLFLALGERCFDIAGAEPIRRFAAGPLRNVPDGAVRNICGPGTLEKFADRHAGCVGAMRSHLVGIITVFGACDVVDFGSVPPDLEGLEWKVAISLRDGSRTRLVTGSEATELVSILTKQLVEERT